MALILGTAIPLFLLLLVVVLKCKLCSASENASAGSAVFDNSVDVTDTPQKVDARAENTSNQMFKNICREDSPSLEDINPDVVPSRGEIMFFTHKTIIITYDK